MKRQLKYPIMLEKVQFSRVISENFKKSKKKMSAVTKSNISSEKSDVHNFGGSGVQLHASFVCHVAPGLKDYQRITEVATLSFFE